MPKNVGHDCDCCTPGGPEQCSPGKFKRVNYFNGMLLTEEDFVDEQTYLREKLKLHNRLHGAGVMWGLELRKDCVRVGSGDRERKITKIFIGGGVALDCAGNEIVVCDKYLVPLDETVEELRRFGQLERLEDCQPPAYRGPRLFVGIKHCECKSQPAEQYTSECADDRLRPQFSRVREGFTVQLFTSEQLPGCHKGGGPDGDSHNCPECRGLYPCRADEQITILGYVENYSTATDHPDHNEATIAPYENYPTTPGGPGESAWAYPRWEAQRQNVLRSVLTTYTDVSPLMGMGTDKAAEWLTQRKLNVGEVYQIGVIDNEREFYEKARRAERWAAPGATVDLVTAHKSKCVVFPIVSVNDPRFDHGDFKDRVNV